MAITISDIAQIAGVSRATVSGVLNNSPLVSKKTKERVMAIIKEYNYRPNEIARALALKHTGLLGLIVKDISNPLYSKITLGVEEACAENGYSVIIGNTHKNWDKEVSHVNLLKRRRVDGLIIFPLQKGTDLSHIRELKEEDYPFVLLAEVPGIEADLVRSDDETGALGAVEHLIKLGRKRIAYITGPDTALASDRRLSGFRRALEKNKISFSEHCVLKGGWRFEDGYTAGKEMLSRGDFNPDGVFCYNDQVAIGFIRALGESGLQVPRDVAVVGFDDAGVSAYLETSLTTVAQPAKKIGYESAKLLIKRIMEKRNKDAEHMPIEKKFLKTELIIRESCGAHAKGSVPSIFNQDNTMEVLR